MIETSTRTVVTFPNTVAALDMESACKAHGIPGHIIPVPNKIYAGCGFAWSAPAEDREELERFMEEKQLIHSDVYTVDI